jgi:uroporphyrinogen decarboxylase
MPDTRPILQGDRKHLLFDQGLPDPLTGGIFAHAHRLNQVMAERIHAGLTYQGRPVVLEPFGLGTDGPFTVAQSLRGMDLFTDFYTDPAYVHQLLDFIVEGTVARIRAHRRFFGLPEVSSAWGLADDAIQMLSTKMVREFVLPAHKKLKAALTTAERISVHLCGDAARHFRLLRDELGAYSFDTGFPLDFPAVRQDLGPEVEIVGGPRVTLLLDGTPAQVAAEARRILQSGVMAGGRFILREANDLAPGTPLANLQAMYQAAREYGCY